MAGSVPHPAGDRNGRRGTGNRGIGGWVSSGRGKNGRQMTGASGAERKSRNSTPYTRRVGTGSALRNTRHRGGRDRRGAGVRGGAFAKPGKQPHAPEGTAGRETKSYNNPMHPKGGGGTARCARRGMSARRSAPMPAPMSALVSVLSRFRDSLFPCRLLRLRGPPIRFTQNGVSCALRPGIPTLP